VKGRRWIGFVAARYVSRGRRNSPSPVFSVLGIATGVLALTVIIAVMNGFQMGFIESILEISSCHLRVDYPASYGETELIENIRSLPDVLSVLPFHELNVLIRGRQTSSRGALIRGVPHNALELDRGLANRLEIESGFFDLESSGSVVLGAELARHLSVRTGDEVNLLSITGTIGEAAENSNQTYTVTGIFRSGFYEYDLGWGFINIDRAEELLNAAGDMADEPPVRKTPVLGIKLKNRWQDQKAISEIRDILAIQGIPENSEQAGEQTHVSSWRDYNRAFFGALRTEKLMMFILVGLIFIVVALNIFQAQRRTVLERREEIGLLRALGASDMAVRLIFVWDGFIIGFTGAGIGLALGLLVAFHIPVFFSMLETAVNFFISVINQILDLWGTAADAGEFSVFSPRIFYIKEIPSRVVPLEVLIIFLFGFFSALFAAWFASGKVSRTKPVEVLRYE